VCLRPTVAVFTPQQSRFSFDTVTGINVRKKRLRFRRSEYSLQRIANF